MSAIMDRGNSPMPERNIVYDLDDELEQIADEIVEALMRNARTRHMPPKNFGEQPLNRQEIMSIEALIAYIAHTQKLTPIGLQTLLEVKFGAETVPSIKRRDYQSVVEYLVDLQDSGGVN
jgi:hypothetical protein